MSDFALVRAACGDRHGNLVCAGSAQNFNPLCAMAGRITIAEVDELVEPGELEPAHVQTPGVFAQRGVVVGSAGKQIEKRTTRDRRGTGPSDTTAELSDGQYAKFVPPRPLDVQSTISYGCTLRQPRLRVLESIRFAEGCRSRQWRSGKT